MPGGIVVWGSKDTVVNELDFKFFNKIIIRDKFSVTIKQGDAYLVKLNTNRNLMDFLAVEQKGAILYVKMKPNHFYKDAILEAEILLPDLIALEVGGMSAVTLHYNKPEGRLLAEVNEDGYLDGDLELERLDLIVKNGSLAELTGKATFLKVEGTAGGKFLLDDLSVERALVYLSSGSEARLFINDIFDAELSKGSTLIYSGKGSERKVNKDRNSQVIRQ